MARVEQDRTDILPGSLEAKTPIVRDPGLPAAQGLYDPSLEKDSCGVGFVADMKRGKSHDVVEMGLQILLNLDHRGAVGADPKAGALKGECGAEGENEKNCEEASHGY